MMFLWFADTACRVPTLLVCLLWFFADARAERPYMDDDIFDKLHKMESFSPPNCTKWKVFTPPNCTKWKVFYNRASMIWRGRMLLTSKRTCCGLSMAGMSRVRNSLWATASMAASNFDCGSSVNTSTPYS